jgi:hypothetical protein
MENIMTDHDEWTTSPERKKGLNAFLATLWFGKQQSYVLLHKDPDGFIRDDGQMWRESKEFANARHAYRKRVNGKENND